MDTSKYYESDSSSNCSATDVDFESASSSESWLDVTDNSDTANNANKNSKKHTEPKAKAIGSEGVPQAECTNLQAELAEEGSDDTEAETDVINSNTETELDGLGLEESKHSSSQELATTNLNKWIASKTKYFSQQRLARDSTGVRQSYPWAKVQSDPVPEASASACPSPSKNDPESPSPEPATCRSLETILEDDEEEEEGEPLPYGGRKISTIVAERILAAHGIRWTTPHEGDIMTPLEQAMVAGTEHLPMSRFLQNIPSPVPRSIEQLARITGRTRLPWRFQY